MLPSARLGPAHGAQARRPEGVRIPPRFVLKQAHQGADGKQQKLPKRAKYTAVHGARVPVFCNRKMQNGMTTGTAVGGKVWHGSFANMAVAAARRQKPGFWMQKAYVCAASALGLEQAGGMYGSMPPDLVTRPLDSSSIPCR